MSLPFNQYPCLTYSVTGLHIRPCASHQTFHFPWASCSTTWAVIWTLSATSSSHHSHTKLVWPLYHLRSALRTSCLLSDHPLYHPLYHLFPSSRADLICAALLHRPFTLHFPIYFYPAIPNPYWLIAAALCYVSHSRASLMGIPLPANSLFAINAFFSHSVLLFSWVYCSSSTQLNPSLAAIVTSLPRLAHCSDPPTSSSPRFSCCTEFHPVLPQEKWLWSSSSSSFAFCSLFPSYHSFLILSHRWKTSYAALFFHLICLPLSQSSSTSWPSLWSFLSSHSLSPWPRTHLCLFALITQVPFNLFPLEVFSPQSNYFSLQVSRCFLSFLSSPATLNTENSDPIWSPSPLPGWASQFHAAFPPSKLMLPMSVLSLHNFSILWILCSHQLQHVSYLQRSPVLRSCVSSAIMKLFTSFAPPLNVLIWTFSRRHLSSPAPCSAALQWSPWDFSPSIFLLGSFCHKCGFHYHLHAAVYSHFSNADLSILTVSLMLHHRDKKLNIS